MDRRGIYGTSTSVGHHITDRLSCAAEDARLCQQKTWPDEGGPPMEIKKADILCRGPMLSLRWA